MAKHLETGQRGELLAAEHLRNEGYHIRDANWRYGKNEIDLIAEKGPFLIFVEVRTRYNNRYGSPAATVVRAKQRLLMRAANRYVEQKDLFKEIRFDIIAVTLQPQLHLEHIQCAFHS